MNAPPHLVLMIQMLFIESAQGIWCSMRGWVLTLSVNISTTTPLTGFCFCPWSNKYAWDCSCSGKGMSEGSP